MTWAPLEAQKTIYTTLETDTSLRTLLGGAAKVFDHVPDNTAYPYVVISQMPFQDRGNHTSEGLQSEFQVTVWYRAPGRGNKGVQDIQKRIDELLHLQELCIDGWNTLLCRRSIIDILTDDDNVTKQGIQRFRLLLGEI